MTREEAIRILKYNSNVIHKTINGETDPNEVEALEMAIKALEQEDILDKIRAEIIKYEGNCRLAVDEYPSCKQCTDNVFKSIYGFFDKYRGESEDKE